MSRCRYLLLIFALYFCSITSAYAKVPVKIIRILDANLFKTANGTIISLANVKTISIYDSDSLRRKFAQKVFAYAQKTLLNQELSEEVIAKNDSVKTVHLWKKMLFFNESVNTTFLKRGYGYFDPNPANKYSKKCKASSEMARRNGAGIYNKAQFRPSMPLKPNALWLTGGLGFGKAKYTRSVSTIKSLSLDASLNFRRKDLVFLIGYQTASWEFYDWITSSYFCFGKSFYQRLSEAIIAVGISRNQWEYDTESKYGIVKSDYYYGPQLKAQIMGHLPYALGFGMSLSINYTLETSYILGTFNLNFGAWNF